MKVIKPLQPIKYKMMEFHVVQIWIIFLYLFLHNLTYILSSYKIKYKNIIIDHQSILSLI